MSDQIVDIIEDFAVTLLESKYGTSTPGGKNEDPPIMSVEQVAKKIRQQVGMELLERRRKLDEFVKDEFLHVRDIREVCKLEEES